MSLAEDLRQSREHEIQMYLASMQAMYDNALLQNGELYDIACEATRSFRNITGQAVLSDSRIIKILRYAIAPSISQMKFGQIFGLGSIDSFEKSRVESGTNKYEQLSAIADGIAQFANEHLDRGRFLWLSEDGALPDQELAERYAKNWTCSIAADQNAQTRYRNWRKDQQEHAIASKLVDLGYTRSAFRGVVRSRTDIAIGEFTQELRVQGRTIQKADLIARSRRNRKLVLIEAKAVGVEIDSTKRIKECCDKANDWISGGLSNPAVVAVIAGFFNETGVANLRTSRVHVVWEHRLSDLATFL